MTFSETGAYANAKTATVKNGRVRVGDRVYQEAGRVVTVTRIHKQGYDGTILTTTPAPKADYPHHFGGRASEFYKVK